VVSYRKQPLPQNGRRFLFMDELTLFGSGKWNADFDSFEAALLDFSELYQESEFGKYTFRFVITNYLTDDQNARRRWMIADCDFDRKRLLTHTKEGLENPDFLGWPYGEIEARQVVGGLSVRLHYNDPYKDTVLNYINRLLVALAQDGLELDPVGTIGKKNVFPLVTLLTGEAKGNPKKSRNSIEYQKDIDKFIQKLKDIEPHYSSREIAIAEVFNALRDQFSDDFKEKYNSEPPPRTTVNSWLTNSG
jgi:hypothetical protein